MSSVNATSAVRPEARAVVHGAVPPSVGDGIAVSPRRAAAALTNASRATPMARPVTMRLSTSGLPKVDVTDHDQVARSSHQQCADVGLPFQEAPSLRGAQ